jgi:hypothetical protein
MTQTKNHFTKQKQMTRVMDLFKLFWDEMSPLVLVA